MGDGAFSNVYKAVDTQSGQKVAIKVVRKFELNSSQRANILKEVQIMRQINHPSVVKLISFSESDEYYFLVLELLEGGELFHQIVKLTYFSENLARHVIVQVAKGIRFLHEECGVVHRDIKPENLLFERIPIQPSNTPISRPYDEEKEDEGEFIPDVGGGGIGRVKIADFGLSKVVWNEETMTPCGTVGYTAPEIVKDERYSKSVDMWALGCVLYTLLCGFPPFYDESINVLTEKVAKGHYTFLSPWWDDISASAKDLITHLLCVDPSQRYTIDEFLAHPWINETPAPPPPPTPIITPATYIPLDSPLLQAVRGGARDGRSPGLATLKEAFDITYAVHRMEEEGTRRRAYKGPGGAGARGFLHGLNESDEDIDGVAEVRAKHGAEAGRVLEAEQTRARAGESSLGQQSHQYGSRGADRHVAQRALYDGRAGTRDQPLRKRGVAAGNAMGFALDIDGATLLGRRHRRAAAEPSPLRQPVSANTPATHVGNAPSPMQGITE
ncbi:kinase-like domain-containing protein [Gautieria morchelliformis]|nr:kinase-like domain-containing protein [Gautieria morchelliformis]